MIFCKNKISFSQQAINKHIFIASMFVFLLFANVKVNSAESDYNELMNTYSNDKQYDEVCWLTSHNSFAYYDSLISNAFIARNQWLNIIDQLKYSVRGFMIDLYYKNDDPKNTIIIAHRLQPEPAIWNRRYFKQDFSNPFLKSIKEWLNNNSQDIITIHLESYIRNYKKIMKEINNAGLSAYLFDLYEYNGVVKKEESTCINNSWFSWLDETNLEPRKLIWPTLGEMREKNKRLVVFSDKREDVGYGIMHTLNTMETLYDLNDYPNCEMRTEEEDRALKAPIFVMNHFYKYMPIPGANIFGSYHKANKYNALLLRAGACCLQENKCPNFIAIDDVGLDESGDRKIVLDINRHNKICHCDDL
jgi:hypothetical protein